MQNHNQSQSPVHHTPLHTGRTRSFRGLTECQSVPCEGSNPHCDARTGWGWVRLSFLLHNLKTAWRNLLRYKVQNIISIACLAVGVVCFAVVFQVGSADLKEMYYTKYDTGRPVFHFYEMTEEEYKNYTPSAENNFESEPPKMYITDSFVEKLYNLELPAMHELHGYDSWLIEAKFEDGTDIDKTCYTGTITCSPRFFHYQKYRSAITGQIIPELNEGEILITDQLRDQVYGKDVDPRGFHVSGSLTKEEINGVISDVLNTKERSNRILNKDIILCHKNFIVKNNLAFFKQYAQIELNEGYTAEDMHEQLASAFPEYYVKLQQPDFDWQTFSILGIVFLLGGSVLLIGVTGFLKMQLQLFGLRSREMALRRTMGAKPRHLYGLLMAEIVLVFALTALVTSFITIQLVHNALPIIQSVNENFVIDTNQLVDTCLWICLVTLAGSIVVVICSVYRQVHSPVGMRVGRSGSPRTIGQSIMICIQFIISMLLTFAVLGAFYILNELADAKYGGVEEDKAPYRNVIMTDLWTMDEKFPGFKDKLMQTGLVEHIGKYYYSSGHTYGTEYDKELFVRTRLMLNENGDTIYGVGVLTTDEETLDLLKVKITAEKPTDEKLQAVTCALYVRSEEVERLREKWNLPISSDVQTRNLYRNNDYTLIGYAMSLMGSRTDSYGVPSYWVIEPDAYREETVWCVQIPNIKTYGPTDHYLIFPKEGKYNEVKEAITDMYREVKPDDMNPLNVNDLYETWFKEIRLIEMMRKLCFMLVVVSILCIMASVYSAISLESRGRQKEVALRKIHGAHTRDIIHLFGNYYLRLLGISALVVSVVSLPFIITLVNNANLMTEMALATHNMNYGNSLDTTDWIMILLYLLLSILIVASITLLTIGNKIYRVSQINAAEVVKKE